ADAVAEWRYGAGIGTRNMVFITFGTGCGAGLILDGRLYSGTNGNAGECGHVRIAPYGPVGFGKAGSMEGFCSGAGIARLGEMRALEVIQMGGKVSWYSAEKPASARDIAVAAAEGDELAKKVYAECGTRLGEALAVLVDILNPEAIVIGSVFQRAEALIRPTMEAALRREALACAEKVCRVLPAKLGDNLGEYAALAMAHE
ncbi:MAG: ROK family protein, partial [Victivallales bacterium]|nr:ROK family protein [Victivallales bacterium]